MTFIRRKRSLNISRQKGGSNSREALFRVNTVCNNPATKVFKDHHIVAILSPVAVGYNKWLFSEALWMKFYSSHGKYKSELNEHFYMYRCQINFAMFCATGAIGDDYGVKADETWIHGDCFYTTKYDIFGDGRNATKRSTTDNLTR